MRRAVNDIIDPSPPDVGPVWDYFEDECAYCGVELDRATRGGHVDQPGCPNGRRDATERVV